MSGKRINELKRHNAIRRERVGVCDRKTPWINAKSLERACNEFLESRGLPRTEYTDFTFHNHRP